MMHDIILLLGKKCEKERPAGKGDSNAEVRHQYFRLVWATGIVCGLGFRICLQQVRSDKYVKRSRGQMVR